MVFVRSEGDEDLHYTLLFHSLSLSLSLLLTTTVARLPGFATARAADVAV